MSESKIHSPNFPDQEKIFSWKIGDFALLKLSWVFKKFSYCEVGRESVLPLPQIQFAIKNAIRYDFVGSTENFGSMYSFRKKFAICFQTWKVVIKKIKHFVVIRRGVNSPSMHDFEVSQGGLTRNWSKL